MVASAELLILILVPISMTAGVWGGVLSGGGSGGLLKIEVAGGVCLRGSSGGITKARWRWQGLVVAWITRSCGGGGSWVAGGACWTGGRGGGACLALGEPFIEAVKANWRRSWRWPWYWRGCWLRKWIHR